MMYCKNIMVIAGCVLLCAACACGRGKSGGTDSDSVCYRESGEEVVSSPDLAFKELSGPVKSAVLEFFSLDNPDEISADSVSYDDEGRVRGLVSYYRSGRDRTLVSDFRFDYTSEGEALPAPDRVAGGTLEARIGRDGLGRIVDFVCELSEDPENGDERAYREEYSWDEYDRLRSYELTGWEWTARTTYSYDAQGRRSKAVTVSSDIGFESTDTQTYSYKAFDSHGNWTEREVKVVSEQDEDGVKSRHTSVRIERRRIHYR